MIRWLREPATKDWIEGILVGAGLGLVGMMVLIAMVAAR